MYSNTMIINQTHFEILSDTSTCKLIQYSLNIHILIIHLADMCKDSKTYVPNPRIWTYTSALPLVLLLCFSFSFTLFKD